MEHLDGCTLLVRVSISPHRKQAISQRSARGLRLRRISRVRSSDEVPNTGATIFLNLGLTKSVVVTEGALIDRTKIRE